MHTNYYKSKFYKKPIEVENIDWEILVVITDDKDREIIYTWYDIDEKNTWSIYINKCLLWWLINWVPNNVLIIWLWWWAYAKYIEDNFYTDTKITWIDIDETMVEIAKTEFLVNTNDIYTMDAKDALNILKRKKINYDLVLIDVYDWSCEIPEYFSDKNFISDIKQVISKEWIISINYSDYIKEDKLKYDKYNLIHNNVLEVIWNEYVHLLSWEDDRWNVMWIYNLDKKYTSEDFNLKYLELVENWELRFDSNIIKDTVIEK